MRTKQRSSQCRVPRASLLLTLTTIILFSCSQQSLAQQRDGNTTNADSNSSSASNGRVNFNIIQLMNGEYLEMFGTGTSRGILRGHPSISAIELGSLSADPLMFSTNSTERMRILANGFVGIGTTNPITPFELHFPDANAYSTGLASASRLRIVNSNTTNNNAVELNLSTVDTSGAVATGVRVVGIFTNHTAGVGSADLSFVLRNEGNWAEVARFASNGNIGVGTNAPAYKFDVAGPIRSTTGGFIFPDGTVQTTAGGGSGGVSQWVTNGSSIFYNSGNVGIGTETPGARLHVSAGNSSFALFGPNVQWGGSLAVGSGTSFLTPISGRAQVLSSNGNLHLDAGISQNVYISWLNAGHTIINGQGGNLGVGTTTPTRKLEIFHDVAGISFEAGTGSPNSGVIRFGDGSGWKLHFGRSRNSGALNSGTAGVLMTVQDNGNVGIGTTTPGHKLDVAGTIRSSSGVFVFPDGTVQTTAGGGPSSQWTTSGVNIFYNSGNVGIGTPTPSAKLEVVGNVNVTGTGNITASGTIEGGNIKAKYQDVAEWVESSQEIVAGTVVVLDSSKSNQVIASTQSYDSRVAGVISRQPGLTLGEAGEGRVLVATTGRVKVKVDATNGPVQIGDLLVTSDREGFAMKSLPVDIGGARMHRPGTLIGKALEPLKNGTGEILVLLSLQ